MNDRSTTHPAVLYTYIGSPVGLLLLAASDAGVHVVDFPDGKHPARPEPGWQEIDLAMLAEMCREDTSTTGAALLLWKTAQQLDEYFSGQRQQFDLPLAPRGTDFQKQVWRALREIPFGQTRSYAQLAQHIGKPSATRAVGAANGRNPIAIIVPCHRVIGADGGLTGFSGGLSAKSYLLKLEGQLLL